jgi:imidazolonepropionase-like amidohydrolase
MSLLPSAGLHINYPVIRTRMVGEFPAPPRRVPYPEARYQYEEQVRKLRQFFDDARSYRQARAAAGPGFRRDLKFDAMIPVLEGKLPVVIAAVRERAIQDALRFAEQQKVRLILSAVREPGAALQEIVARKIPVILGRTFQVPLNEDDPYDAAYSLPAELHKAGVKFAFGTFSTSFSRNLPYEASNAVAFGLPYDVALRAVTLTPAEIFGIDDRVGSIEKGKLANLVVTDGDLLETRTRIRHVLIRGREVSLDNKHLRLYEKYRNRP